MEDVLEVYQRPHDPDRPVVCLDETTKQLIKETRLPVPAKPGRAALDYAHVLRDLSDRYFTGASKIVLVQDNLSTHKPASLYEAFPAAEARSLVERFEWHYTPKHGSWLNMAEIELAMLAGQCWTGGWPTGQPWSERSRPGRRRVTGPVAGSTGASRPRTPGSSSSTSSPQLRADEPLRVWRRHRPRTPRCQREAAMVATDDHILTLL